MDRIKVYTISLICILFFTNIFSYCYRGQPIDIHDIGISSIMLPDYCKKGDELFIIIVLENYGSYDETNIQLIVRIENEKQETLLLDDIFNINLNINEKKTFNLTWHDTVYCNGILTVRTQFSSDQNPCNDIVTRNFKITDEIFNDVVTLTPVYWEHKDLTQGKSSNWEIINSGYDSYLKCSNKKSDRNSTIDDESIINSTFNLLLFDNVVLSYDVYCDFAKFEEGYVEVSIDEGRHWDILKIYKNNTNWISEKLSLSDYRTNDVRIRFRFFSNVTNSNLGWLLDDISLRAENYMLFQDSFENGIGSNWIIQQVPTGDLWQPLYKTKNGNTSNLAWWSGDEEINKYRKNMNNTLILSKSIDISKHFDIEVSFITWFNISKGDTGFFEIKLDDNKWETIDAFNESSLSNEDNGWVKKDYLFNMLNGDLFTIRFRFISDDYIESEGWYIDNITIHLKYDNIPPNTNLSIIGISGNEEWFTSYVQINIDADDADGSSLDNIYYRINDSEVMIYISPFNLGGCGRFMIEYWSIDKLCNEDNRHRQIVKIDNIIPCIDFSYPIAGIYLNGKKIIPLTNYTSTIFWHSPIVFGDISFVVDISDSVSGVQYTEFYLDGELMKIDYEYPYQWTWDKKAFFVHEIKAIGHDNAGNSAESTMKVIRMI